MSYPIKRFWFLNRSIDRLQAEQDLRMIQIAASAGSQDGYSSLVDRLNKSMGEIVVFEQSMKTLNLDDDTLDPQFDRQGLHALMGRAPPKKKEVKDEE